MGYMIEGGGSKTMMKAKKWLYKYPKESHNLLTILCSIIADYLTMQAENGAQALQVFESNAEYLNSQLFDEYLIPYLKHIVDTVRKQLKAKKIEEVPMVSFVYLDYIVISS